MSVLWGAALLALVLGCQGIDSDDTSDSHDHDHHSADHHIPPHYPADFLTAVDRVQELIDSLALGKSMEPVGTIEPTQELNDLLRWLPELAADTDLPEAEWNQVDRFASEATVHLTRWNETDQPDKGIWQTSLRELPQLKMLAQQTIRSSPTVFVGDNPPPEGPGEKASTDESDQLLEERS